MTATLEQIRQDPGIIERAIAEGTLLEIMQSGQIAATLKPTKRVSREEALRFMQERFEKQDWEFEAGPPITRDERNSRG